MKTILDFLATTYLEAIICILIGTCTIWWTNKRPEKKEDSWQASDISGWAGGIGFTLIGITIIIAKLVGKL